MLRAVVPEILCWAGVGLVAWGLWMITPAAALIVLGGAIVLFSVEARLKLTVARGAGERPTGSDVAS